MVTSHSLTVLSQLGRGTYEIFAAHWPNAPQEQQVLAEPLNALPKHVASTTLHEPLGRQSSRLPRGDVGALKAEEGKDLRVIGGPGLVQTPMVLGLVDELQLMIDPLVVGGGKHLFRDDGALRPATGRTGNPPPRRNPNKSPATIGPC